MIFCLLCNASEERTVNAVDVIQGVVVTSSARILGDDLEAGTADDPAGKEFSQAVFRMNPANSSVRNSVN